MSLYSSMLEKILSEVDPDIRETMLSSDGRYKAYEMLPDPANTILAWQAMRDRKNDNIIIEGKPSFTEEPNA